MSIKLGCAKVDITPDHPVFLCGYASRNTLSTQVADPLEAGVMLMEGNGSRTLHITVDSTGLDSVVCRRLMAELSHATGYPSEEFIISCSHTHFAPGVTPYYVCVPNGGLAVGLYPADEAYYALLVSQLTKGIREAAASLEPVTVEEADIQLPQLLFNRRTIIKATGKVETNYLYPENDADYEFQPVDASMTVWRFRTEGGQLKALLARYSAHPVTGGTDNGYAISADYPGFFKKYVQDYFGCPGFFMLGTNGDAVPLQRNGTSRDDIGNSMARAIRMAERTFRKAPDFQVGITKAPIPLKLRLVADRATCDDILNKKFDDIRRDPNFTYEEAMYAFLEKHEHAKMYPTDDVTLEMTVARLGSKILVFLPFEALTDIGTQIKQACPNAIVISISNGYDGYMPLEKEYARGGYEATEGPRFHYSAGDEIVQLAIKTIQTLK